MREKIKKKPSLQRAQTQFDSPQNLIEFYLNETFLKCFYWFLCFFFDFTPNSVSVMNNNGIIIAITITINGVDELIKSSILYTSLPNLVPKKNREIGSISQVPKGH